MGLAVGEPDFHAGLKPSQKPPVSLFVHRFPVLSETFVVGEVRALVALGYQVSVEARHAPDDPTDLAPPGVEIFHAEHETRRERLVALAWLLARHPRRAGADLRNRRAKPPSDRGVPLRRLAPRARRCARRGPRVHLHSHFAATAADEAYRIARLIGATTSLTAHAYDIYLTPRRLRERLVRTDFSTSGCEYTVEHLRKVAGPAHSGSIFKQIMGVDTSAFKRRGPLPNGRHVVAVGRLVEKKGFLYLIRAAALLPDVTVSILGEGPDCALLEAEIDLLGVADRCKLLGAASPGGVRELLERADLLCMPCVVAGNGDRDSMPVVVKEAMAMEVCVVCSDEVGLSELVQPPWGVLVAPGEEGSLADGIRQILDLRVEERARLGAAARQRVMDYADVNRETAKLSSWIVAAASEAGDR